MAPVVTFLSDVNPITSLQKRKTWNWPVEWRYTNSFEDLVHKLNDDCYETDFVSIDIDKLYNLKTVSKCEAIHTVKTLVRINKNPATRNARIVGIVSDTTPVDYIKEMVDCIDVDYLTVRIDNKESPEITKESARIYVGEKRAKVTPYITDMIKHCSPTNCIKRIPMPKVVDTAPKPKKEKPGTIRLTARQGQVLDLVKNRGASNKVIARMLNISESTVKLHLTAILKKYGARNRTQLALFASKEKV